MASCGVHEINIYFRSADDKNQELEQNLEFVAEDLVRLNIQFEEKNDRKNLILFTI